MQTKPEEITKVQDIIDQGYEEGWPFNHQVLIDMLTLYHLLNDWQAAYGETEPKAA